MTRDLAGVLITVAAIAALGGCAGDQWQKPGATQDQFVTDKAQCSTIALLRYPVLRVGQPAVQTAVDSNQAPRDAAIDFCLKARGWQPPGG